ncbi:hypothetical protein [Halorhabdus sp. CUG00001]|uniref:hypothetical protein n=1 Tax=Halorhabdus sp. CUG00001 TaxID=2600297 RepID=UPI00131C8B33|nr:hypothetical protein [Halorhabdus sp. CUG00001]
MDDERPTADHDVDLDQPTSLDFEALLADGLDGLLSRTGAQLVVLISAIGIVSTVFWQSLQLTVSEAMITYLQENFDATDSQVQTALTELEGTVDALGLTIDISVPTIVAGIILLALLGEAINIVAIRAFADGALDGIPRDLVTRRLGVATLYGFLGGIVLLVAIGLGLLLLVIPAIFVYVGTLFFRQEIAVADKGPARAISGTWALTKGNRWLLFGVAVVLFLVGFVVPLFPGAISGTFGTVASVFVSSIVGVFSIATITEAYVRLRRQHTESM